MIHDPKHRPVYKLTGGRTYVGQKFASLYLWSDSAGRYLYERVETVEDILGQHPNAVRHVEKRATPSKPRPPGVHYRPSGQGAWCGISGNARLTTDVSRVTCKACLEVITRRMKKA